MRRGYYEGKAGRQAHRLIPDTVLVSAAKFETFKLVGTGQRCAVMSVPDISIIYETFSGSTKILSLALNIW